MNKQNNQDVIQPEILEFIDLCVDNYKNGGHSSTKKMEYHYYELKHLLTIRRKSNE